MFSRHRKLLISSFMFMLCFALTSPGQSFAAQYNLSDYFVGGTYTEMVYALDEFGPDWNESGLRWMRYKGANESLTTPIGTNVTGAMPIINSWNETKYYKKDESGNLYFHALKIENSEDDEFLIRYRYNFVTAPTSLTAPVSTDFAASNLASPSHTFPTILDTATPYTHTFAEVKYDLDGSNPASQRVAVVTITTDDNAGSLYNYSALEANSASPFYDPAGEASTVWATTPSILTGLLKITIQYEFYWTNGKKVKLIRTQFRKSGIGLVAEFEKYINLANSTVIEKNMSRLVKYNISNGANTASAATLQSKTLKVDDGAGNPVSGSWIGGDAFKVDESNNPIFSPDGRPVLDYWTGSLLEDTPGSGLFTLYFWDGVPLKPFYGAPGYVEHTSATTFNKDTADNFLYSLTTRAVQVTFHAKNSSGEPLENIWVEASPQAASPTTGGGGGDTTGQDDGETDSTGSVTLSLSPTVTSYSVRAWPQPGSAYLGGPWQGDGLNDTTYATVNVKNNWPGASTAFAEGNTLELVLGAGIAVSGKVTNSSDEGVAGVKVSAEPEWDQTTQTSTGAWQETTTDSSGNYSMYVSPGKYKIQFRTKYWNHESGSEVSLPGGYISGFANGSGGVVGDWMQANVFDITTSATVNAQLAQGLSISGVVVNKTFQPISSRMNVNIHTADWSKQYHGDVSNTNGTFSVFVEPGSTYIVEFWPGWDPNTNTEDTTYSGGSFIVHPDPYGDGTINPVFEAGYSITDPSTKPLIVGSSLTQAEIDAYQAAIDPGGMVAAMTAAGITDHIPGMVMNVGDQHIVTGISLDKNVKIVAQVEAGTALKGRLVDESGNGIANGWVNAMVTGTNTDANGCFTLKMPTSDILTGSVSTFQVDVHPGWDPVTNTQTKSFIGGVVTFNDPNYNLTPNWSYANQFKMDLTDWPAIDISNPCGEGVTGLKITAPKGISIQGTVTAGGTPVQNIWVNAWSQESGFGNGANTDSSGNYSIAVEGNANGVTYEVGIWDPTYINPEPLKVTVIDTDVTGQNFSLSTGNAIKGRVVDSDGKGLAWMWVNVFTKDNSKWYGNSTNDNGYYSIPVADGTYIAKVDGWGPSGQQLYKTNFYKNASSMRTATPIIVSGAAKDNINFRMTSGSYISGLLNGLAKGDRVWLDVWSESSQSWGGTEVVGDADTSSPDSFKIQGLSEASDYRLNINGGDYISGNYGGTPGGDYSAPVNWDKATMLDTTGGNVTDVKITMSKGATLKVTITGIASGESFDANAWSDTQMKGGWGNATSTGSSVTITLSSLDPSGTDYRLRVDSRAGSYKSGHYNGDLTSTNAGTLVNWDRATLINMGSGDVELLVNMSSGGSIAGVVTGLAEGSRAWIDAWSESTWAWGGTEVIGAAGGSVPYTIKGLELANDFRVGIWGQDIPGGYYNGANGLTTWERAGRVDINPPNNANITGINLTLPTGRQISGTITNLKSGEWAWLDAWSDETFSWGGKNVEAGGTESDNYTIKGLLPNSTTAGGYMVNFSSEGYVHKRLGPVDLSGADATGKDFAATTGGSIGGSISGLTANEKVWLDAWSQNSGSGGWADVTADASGNATYKIKGLADATDYVVSLNAISGWFVYNSSGPVQNWSGHEDVTVADGADTTGKNFALAAIETFKISGAISGLEGSEVVDINAWSTTGNGSGWTSRGGNGNYTIKGLPAGNYTVEVRSHGYLHQRTKTGMTLTAGAVETPLWTTSWDETGSIAVSPSVTGLNISMSKGYSIKGTVTDGSNPIPYTWVNAWSKTSHVGNGAMTNSAGEYSIEGLPSATYKLEVFTSSGDASIDVTVDGADLTGKDIIVTKASGSISGTVTSNSAAVEQALIMVYNNNTNQFIVGAATASDGTYKVDDLDLSSAINSDYRVEVYLPTTSITGTANGSTTVTVTGEITGKDFAL